MYGYHTGDDRFIVKIIAAALAALFFLTMLPPQCADTASAEKPSPDITISRMLLNQLNKERLELKAENESLKEQISALRKERQIASSAHKKNIIAEKKRCSERILSERIRHRKQVSILKKPPAPTACYVALGVCGALVVGAGIGGYYAGQNLRAPSARNTNPGTRILSP